MWLETSPLCVFDMFFCLLGAHMNAAVSFTMCLFGRLSWKMLPLYILTQFIGSFLAAGTVYTLYYGKNSRKQLLTMTLNVNQVVDFAYVSLILTLFVTLSWKHFTRIATCFITVAFFVLTPSTYFFPQMPFITIVKGILLSLDPKPQRGSFPPTQHIISHYMLDSLTKWVKGHSVGILF